MLSLILMDAASPKRICTLFELPSSNFEATVHRAYHTGPTFATCHYVKRITHVRSIMSHVGSLGTLGLLGTYTVVIARAMLPHFPVY